MPPTQKAARLISDVEPVEKPIRTNSTGHAEKNSFQIWITIDDLWSGNGKWPL